MPISSWLVTVLTSTCWPMSNTCQINAGLKRPTWRDIASVLQWACNEGWWWSGATGASWQYWMKYKVQSSRGGRGLVRRLHSSIFVFPSGSSICDIDPPQAVEVRKWRGSTKAAALFFLKRRFTIAIGLHLYSSVIPQRHFHSRTPL